MNEPFWSRLRRWYIVQPTTLRTVLAINVCIYLAWMLLFRYIGFTAGFFYSHLTLNPGLPGILMEPWQLVTYNFLHLGRGFWGFLHLAFNMLWLFWIGREYEEMHGSPKMLAIFLLGGIGGGLLTVFLHALFPGVPNFGGPVYGASASVLAVIFAVATLYPYKSVALLFIGVVPLKYIAIGFLALDILFGLDSNVSISAHFGGALTGYLLARAERNGVNFSGWAHIFFGHGRSRSRSQGRGRQPANGSSRLKQRLSEWLPGKAAPRPSGPAKIHQLSEANAVVPRAEQQEVDRILDKISEEGYESLSAEEKRILYEASRK